LSERDLFRKPVSTFSGSCSSPLAFSCICLTEKGRNLLREARPAWARAQRHVEEVFGTNNTGALNAALDRMLEKFA